MLITGSVGHTTESTLQKSTFTNGMEVKQQIYPGSNVTHVPTEACIRNTLLVNKQGSGLSAIGYVLLDQGPESRVTTGPNSNPADPIQPKSELDLFGLGLGAGL